MSLTTVKPVTKFVTAPLLAIHLLMVCPLELAV